MAAQAEVPVSVSLTAFCITVVEKHGSSWPISEELLASEFTDFFKLTGITHLWELRQLCSQLEIEFREAPLPDCLRGYNISYSGKRILLVSDELAPWGGVEHTILHELRELIEYELAALGKVTFQSSNGEELAEEFAVRTCVLGKEAPEWFDGVSKIERTWPRRFGYLLAILMVVGYAAGILLFPKIEEWHEQQKRKSKKLKHSGHRQSLPTV